MPVRLRTGLLIPHNVYESHDKKDTPMITKHLHPAIVDAMNKGHVYFEKFRPGRDENSTSIHCIVSPTHVTDAFEELENLPAKQLKNPDLVDDVTLRIGLGNVQTTNEHFEMDGARLLELDIVRVGGVRASFVVARKAVFGSGNTPEQWKKNTVTFTGDGK